MRTAAAPSPKIASEFEFGAIPRALTAIAKYSAKQSAVTGQLQLGRNVSYLCEDIMQPGVEDTIRQLAQDGLRLKEPSFFRECLEGDEFAQRYNGWLELNNNFMFFVDAEMFNKSLKLFGIGNSGQPRTA